MYSRIRICIFFLICAFNIESCSQYVKADNLYDAIYKVQKKEARHHRRMRKHHIAEKYREFRSLAMQQEEAEDLWTSDTIYVVQSLTTDCSSGRYFGYECIFSPQKVVSYVSDCGKSPEMCVTYLPKDVITDIANWDVSKMSNYVIDDKNYQCACPCDAYRIIKRDDMIDYDYVYFEYDECASYFGNRLQRIKE